jgi:hypothetical protein
MKQVFTLSLFLLSFSLFSQQKSTSQTPKNEVKPASETVTDQQTPAINPRSARTSSQNRVSETAPVLYDVNDKYMGRKTEFLNNLTVSELPHDFPLYTSELSLRDYNNLVDAFYFSHKDILRDKVKEKIFQK